MKAHVTNIWLEEARFRVFGAIRIDFSNDYHLRIEIANRTPEKLALALKNAAFLVSHADHNGALEVQS